MDFLTGVFWLVGHGAMVGSFQEVQILEEQFNGR